MILMNNHSCSCQMIDSLQETEQIIHYHWFIIWENWNKYKVIARLALLSTLKSHSGTSCKDSIHSGMDFFNAIIASSSSLESLGHRRVVTRVSYINGYDSPLLTNNHHFICYFDGWKNKTWKIKHMPPNLPGKIREVTMICNFTPKW